jgi:hypothetical protein
VEHRARPDLAPLPDLLHVRATAGPVRDRRPVYGPHRYLSLLERAAAAVDVPVIASLNGASPGGWTDYAVALAEAGAAAIELNIYHLPADPMFPGRDVEQRHVEVLTTVKAVVKVPVAVKLSPYFSSTGRWRCGSTGPAPTASCRSTGFFSRTSTPRR